MCPSRAVLMGSLPRAQAGGFLDLLCWVHLGGMAGAGAGSWRRPVALGIGATFGCQLEQMRAKDPGFTGCRPARVSGLCFHLHS